MSHQTHEDTGLFLFLKFLEANIEEGILENA